MDSREELKLKNFVHRQALEALVVAKAEADRREERWRQCQRGWYDVEGVRQGGLISFVRYFWGVLEPETALVDGWPLWAICEHLEAVTFNEVKRLLINVPPGFMKSMLTDVFWPAWEWGPMGKTHYRYVAFSYSQHLTVRDNDKFRTLLVSPKYQAMYGVSTTAHFAKQEPKNGVAMRNTQVVKVMNNATGWKLASSVGGVTLGERGDRVIIDDPHNTQEVESDVERSKVIRWFRESVPSRLNDLDKGAIVIIMQRLHEEDVSGVALGDDFDYCHLCIPWEFDPGRAFGDGGKIIENEIGWFDPRADLDNEDGNAGEPAWTERYSDKAIANLRREMGPYAFAAYFEQAPVPRGKGIFQPEWWGLWDPPNKLFPDFSFVLASLDGAYTEDEQNDPSALTVWGIFESAGKRGIMLIAAWAKHLQFSAKRQERRPNETYQVWKQRTKDSWGLMEWVYDSCTHLYGKPLKVDRLLIEDKGPGHSAAQELRNRYGIHEFGIQLVKTKGDKVARALAIQPVFSNGLVWAPKYDWSELVIRQALQFPYGKHDDLVDSMTQAIRFARDAGLLQSDEERSYLEHERLTARPRQHALYPV